MGITVLGKSSICTVMLTLHCSFRSKHQP